MNLNQKIVTLLKRKKLKISFAESCTGGLLSSAVTSVNGSSKVFTMGLVTYSNQAKITALKVQKNIIKKYGAVSIQCCLAMVNNLSKISKSKNCVSVTGVAGPKGGSTSPAATIFDKLINAARSSSLVVTLFEFISSEFEPQLAKVMVVARTRGVSRRALGIL